MHRAMRIRWSSLLLSVLLVSAAWGGKGNRGPWNVIGPQGPPGERKSRDHRVKMVPKAQLARSVQPVWPVQQGTGRRRRERRSGVYGQLVYGELVEGRPHG